MGTLQKFFGNTFANKTGNVSRKTLVTASIPDEERSSFTKAFKPKNNRKRTPGRKFYYQKKKGRKSEFKNFIHESK